uniref:Uncharacterized protein n=1 Tax=Candidatus Kentrum sp. MB TaxID=2138164 RepID=A0A450XE32_9GAMM|nr:MAG: hypothetical protein BECKMB1821I_GA0114274_100367 [Candidatus Kentron sp. MB]VFK74337.1 MAG: hypothetical protein BECKMB1821H_GA0114242_100367 [Candidatus Kentron sp. MB]
MHTLAWSYQLLKGNCTSGLTFASRLIGAHRIASVTRKKPMYAMTRRLIFLDFLGNALVPCILSDNSEIRNPKPESPSIG